MATMFERHGGFATLRRVISAFYDKVLDSPTVSHHFANVDMRRLVEHQTRFLTFLMDGPGVDYSDDMLRRVHQSLEITAGEFAEMLALLRETLEDFGFDDPDVEHVMAQLRAREPLIVKALSPR